ncbi:MAG: 3-oxo-tetronate kinase [Burkholderiaceae bacterium]
MLLGIIADDFTGASDIANTLARGGLATTQFLGVPTSAAPASCEAGVVALKSRSIPAADAVAQSLSALRWLQAQGCRQFVFKYCSTFDSTPAGNIGPVGEALARTLGVAGVVACPAFPTTGRTIFHGHLFVGDRLLSESSLRNHPLNPMTDSDLRRWLRQQTNSAVGLVAHATVARGAQAIQEALAACAGRGEWLVIVDAINDADLRAIGLACADAPLLTGGSGIALGLPANFVTKGLAGGAGTAVVGISGPAAILAGSCSARTLEQIEYHKALHPSLAIEPESVVRGETTTAQLVAFIRANEGRVPLVYSSAAPEQVNRAQLQLGRETVAHRIEELFADTARALVDAGIRRLVIAGGETSGAVVSALGLASLEIGPEIDPGVPALYSRENAGLALALKSGNFGSPDFFEKAVTVLAAGSSGAGR